MMSEHLEMSYHGIVAFLETTSGGLIAPGSPFNPNA